MAYSEALPLDDSFTINAYEEDDFTLYVEEDKRSNCDSDEVINNGSADLTIETDAVLSSSEEGDLVIDTDAEGESSNEADDVNCAVNKKETTEDSDVIEKTDKRFHCSMCGFSASTKSSVSKHTKDHSRNIPLLNCKFCKFQCFAKRVLSLHGSHCPHRTLKEIECSQCDFRTFRYKFLNKHIKRVHLGEVQKKKKKTLYRCGKCEFTSKELEEMRKHRIDLHPKKRFTCTICNLECVTSKSLSKHMSRHDLNLTFKKVTIHQCDVCDYTSKYTVNIRKHREKHFKEQLALCSN